VITPDGIVGKTRDVFAHTSQVLEISDVTSGAGVIMVDTRIQGVLRGNSWGQPEIVNLSPDGRIRAGEPFVTSGGDSIYPRGLAVGTVDRVVSQPEGTLVNVLVKPAANLARLEEVLIITSTGSQMPAAMQTDLSDAQQRASDILAERLPSREDPNAPAANAQGQSGQNPAGQATKTGPDLSLPTPPPQPPAAVHPDRYSTSSVPPADEMVPGQRASAPSVPSATSSGQPAAAPDSGSGSAAAPRHPAVPSGNTAAPKKSSAPAPGTTPDTSSVPVKKPPAQPPATTAPASPAPAQPKPATPQPAAPQRRN
jgi:rod shape-determining protein MreC